MLQGNKERETMLRAHFKMNKRINRLSLRAETAFILAMNRYCPKLHIFFGKENPPVIDHHRLCKKKDSTERHRPDVFFRNDEKWVCGLHIEIDENTHHEDDRIRLQKIHSKSGIDPCRIMTLRVCLKLSSKSKSLVREMKNERSGERWYDEVESRTRFFFQNHFNPLIDDFIANARDLTKHLAKVHRLNFS